MKISTMLMVASGLALAAVAMFAPDAVAAVFAFLHPAHAGHGAIIASAAAAAIDPEELKKAISPVMTAFEEFKVTNDSRLKEIEKKGSADVVTKEKLERIEGTLSQYEALNQKVTFAEQQAKAAKEVADRVETALARIPNDNRARKDGAEAKALFNNWCKAVVRAHALGIVNLSADEQKVLADVSNEAKALGVSTDTTGGYLAPTEYVAEIIKAITLSSPARSLVRVRNTANKAIQIPKRTAQFAARRVTEQGTKTETTGLTYGLEELTAPEGYALIDISNQMLEDSAFDMEAEINMEASEQFAVKEGAEFVSGTGIGEMEGILTNGSVAETVSGTAATIADANGQADGLLTLKYSIKTGYARNATWIMNRTTMGSVRKLKDGQKNYIWMPGIQNGQPNTIDGDPYAEFPDMPSEGAGLYPIAYGDFRRAYTMVDRIVMEMLRDPYTQATAGNIRFIFRKRWGGRVTLAEAIRKLKCST
ncbi:phage major capsid protein [Mesorhizobium sp. M2D.F.Ca.ET.232.01.1.1]|uniref:phage major capsid protein n=1 Tax=Mesorhizobium sp. M2D.F.Ca.ET.232.01.1.1 TaxID=2496670 RepID=UPI001FDF2E59|nr:phage major capsid protein [Mesorhizobium sp. M2D.F.Ca.ET.232.01.1.1]